MHVACRRVTASEWYTKLGECHGQLSQVEALEDEYVLVVMLLVPANVGYERELALEAQHTTINIRRAQRAEVNALSP